MADKQEKDLNQASDCAWVRGLDANGNPIKLNKADLFNVIDTVMHLGKRGIEGCVFLTDNYHQGNLASLGQMYSSGSMYIGYGMKNEKGKYLSTTAVKITRKIFIFGPDGLRVGSSTIQSTPIDQEITEITWKDF